MEFIERLNRSMEYIEQHLRAEIDMDRAARCVYLSKDSFLRLFSQMTGMTVAQYVRRRRLTLAVTDLRQSDDKILDIALRYGYQEEGKAPQELHPGDVVNIPANVKHWHGAAKDCWFQHLAIEVPGEGGGTEWCEPVTDDAYCQLV